MMNSVYVIGCGKTATMLSEKKVVSAAQMNSQTLMYAGQEGVCMTVISACESFRIIGAP